MKNNLFPFIFGREGGASIEKFNDFKKFKNFDESLIKLQRDVDIGKNELVTKLFIIVGNEDVDMQIKNGD